MFFKEAGPWVPTNSCGSNNFGPLGLWWEVWPQNIFWVPRLHLNHAPVCLVDNFFFFPLELSSKGAFSLGRPRFYEAKCPPLFPPCRTITLFFGTSFPSFYCAGEAVLNLSKLILGRLEFRLSGTSKIPPLRTVV